MAKEFETIELCFAVFPGEEDYAAHSTNWIPGVGHGKTPYEAVEDLCKKIKNTDSEQRLLNKV